MYIQYIPEDILRRNQIYDGTLFGFLFVCFYILNAIDEDNFLFVIHVDIYDIER